jgi:hypothetical protein
MTLQDAINKNLLTIKEEEGIKWIIEVATGEKVMTISPDDKATTIHINHKGIVTSIFL